MSEPKQYEVPEGHLIQLGADVLGGWEARRSPTSSWLGAGYCRTNYPTTFMETRRTPERMVTVELPESVALRAAHAHWYSEPGAAVQKACPQGPGGRPMSDDRETWYRVPRSAEECAAHKLANGNLLTSHEGGKRWEPCHRTAAQLADVLPRNFRLVYSTPVGMSPVIGAPGHAYGLAKDAPEEWDGRNYATDKAWGQDFGSAGSSVVEARPPAPAPAPEPRTEMVPLTKLVGRTLVGEERPVHSWWPCEGGRYAWCVSMRERTKDLPVDVETGMVEVLAEEEA